VEFWCTTTTPPPRRHTGVVRTPLAPDKRRE